MNEMLEIVDTVDTKKKYNSREIIKKAKNCLYKTDQLLI